MQLLYIWNAAYSGATESRGYTLSSRYEILFNRSSRELSIHWRKDVLARDFWGGHICDVMAVIGRNGAGKTRLAYSIMETLEEAVRLKAAASYPQRIRFPFLLIFEDESSGSPELKIYTTEPELSVNTSLPYIICPLRSGPHSLQDSLERFKFAYFTDSLSLADCKNVKYGGVYDASLGGAIRNSFKYSREMQHISGQGDPVVNYFDNEMDDILKFVCFDRKQEGIPFVLPKWVTFNLKDYWVNLNYIAEELERMGCPDRKNILQKKCQAIQERYGMTMSSNLSIHLMLNIFKTFCIPQTSSEHLEKTAEDFLGKISRLECRRENVFDTMLDLMSEMRQTVGESTAPYEDMFRWLRLQPTLQPQRVWGGWVLSLTEDLQTVKELYAHYTKTKFPYPYFSISFGLSTGEYAFLRRFVRINGLLSQNLAGEICVTNNLGCEVKCDSLMLYFDEADQSLHPDWQRKYLDWLLQFVSSRFKTCSVQIVIATHSPIMLSDIPRNHVLYLQKNGEEIQAEKREIRTFGSNIHDLFRDAFFLDEGTMGAFAERKIHELVRLLREHGDQSSTDDLELIEEIGDDVIRSKLRQMCQIRPASEPSRPAPGAVEETIRLLRSQVKRLQMTIDELEHMNYD